MYLCMIGCVYMNAYLCALVCIRVHMYARIYTDVYQMEQCILQKTLRSRRAHPTVHYRPPPFWCKIFFVCRHFDSIIPIPEPPFCLWQTIKGWVPFVMATRRIYLRSSSKPCIFPQFFKCHLLPGKIVPPSIGSQPPSTIICLTSLFLILFLLLLFLLFLSSPLLSLFLSLLCSFSPPSETRRNKSMIFKPTL